MIGCSQQYEFLRQYSSDPKNTVIGLVRNKPATEQKVSEDPDLKGRSNIVILEADITNYNALQVRSELSQEVKYCMLTEFNRKLQPTRPRSPVGASTTSLATRVL